MPVKKGKNCFGDVMREGYAGELHSGKKGPVVTNPSQMKAIAASMCYDEGCGGACGCKSCPRAKARVQTYREFGYSDEAADALVFGQQPAALGYPTPNFGPEVMDAINAGEGGLWANVHAKRKRMKAGSGERKAKKGDKDYPKTLNLAEYSEDVEANMALARIDVMRGRLDEMAMRLAPMMELGEVEMDVWMHDKLTLAADYISAVADAVMYGGGVELEIEEEEEKEYAEGIYEKGLTAKEKKSAKKTAEKRVKKTDEPADKAFAPFPSDKSYNKRNKGKKMPESKATKAYKDKFGDTSDNAERPDYPDVDKDGDRKETMESAVKNAKAQKKKAEKAGIKVDHAEFKEKEKKGLAKKAEDSGIPIGILRSVYAKGMAAWKSGHRPGTTPQQWAMARVNSFITGSGGARKADPDLWKRAAAAKKSKGK